MSDPGIERETALRPLRGSELVRRLQKLARKREVTLAVEPERGKGSHQTIYYGESRSIIPDLKKELKPGTLAGILKNLGLRPSDLE